MAKVSFPLMGDYNVPAYFLLKNVLNVDIVLPPKITSKTISIGSKYSPEFVCTPFKYTLGTMIEAIENGADTLIQFGGGCRYGYYAELQGQIIKDLGYDVRVFNFIVEGKVDFKRIYRILKDINPKLKLCRLLYYVFVTLNMVKYMDHVDEYIRNNIGFEVNEGSFENLKYVMLSDFSKVKSYYSLRKIYKKYIKEFSNIEVRKSEKTIKVGIIGELYTIMEPFSNYFLEKQLAKNHIEIKRFTNVKYLLLEKKYKIKKYLKDSKKYIMYELGADGADNVARAKYLCENDFDGIIHIKSSFCTPEIGAMPIINKVCNDYNVPIIFFSFDAMTSEEGIRTRLEAFYDMLEMRKNK